MPGTPEAAETMARGELEALQLGLLRQTVGRIIAARTPLARRLDDAGIAGPGDISSLGDLTAIEPTSKEDLRTHYPFGMLAVDREQVVRVQASSGTGGKPTIVGLTRGDLEAWTGLMARCMTMAGVRKGMVVHNANGYGLFTGGFGFHQGAEHIGATVVPVSGGFTARQVTLLEDLRAEVLVSTPSYALVIGEALAAAGKHPSQLRLELGLFGGEPWTEPMRAAIETSLGLTAINFYGLSELCGPGVAAECPVARDGLHVSEDHFLAEVIDPADGRHLPPGAPGELVFTTLRREAMPLIRYRTGDIGTIVDDPCPCGRTTVRLKGLDGRHDDMLIIRGVNVHPSQVDHVVSICPGITSHYRIVVDRPAALDELTVECEPADAVGGGHLGELASRLEDLLRQHLALRVSVRVVEPGTLPRSDGKAVRVLDRRQ